MQYMVVIRREAQKKLQSLPRPDRARIAEKIYRLGLNPDDPVLDVKRLQGEPYYRLRGGNWRVIFDRQDTVKVIAIERIKRRGSAYK